MTTHQGLTLREVALQASQRVGGLQGRALDREAKKRGLTLSYTTVDRIIAGTYNSRPTSKTLEALAELAGIPAEDVFAAADIPMPSKSLAEQLPPEADMLTGAQRRVVIDVVRIFAKQNRELHEARAQIEEREDRDERSAPTKLTGGSPVTRLRAVSDDDDMLDSLPDAADDAPDWEQEAEDTERST